MRRQELENKAIERVCSCYYYELKDSIDAMSEEELQRIIDRPFWGHIDDELNNPTGDLYEALSNCTQFTGYASLEQSKLTNRSK